MKLCFSTKGWPDSAWFEFREMAEEYRFDGIELHAPQRDIYRGEGAPFSDAEINRTVRHMVDRGYRIPCVDSGSNLAGGDNIAETVQSVQQDIALAQRMRSPYVCVHAAVAEGQDFAQAFESVQACLNELLPYAARAGVMVLLETEGIFADTEKLRDLLNYYAHDSLGAVWELNAPVRVAGESPEETIENLGAYVRHVHMKDSEVIDGSVQYRLMGEGSLPMEEIFMALRSINYDGFYGFEWCPEWMRGIIGADVALPHFANYMHVYRRSMRKKHRLYSNKAGTGKYVWKKDLLIEETFPQVLDRMAEEFPDQYAIKYTTLDYTRTYSEFRDDVDTFARSLIALGVEAGDHVSIWATNLPQWYIAFWAVTKIGAVLVTVNTAYKIHEAEYLLRQSDTHTLIMIDGYRDSNYAEIMTELCPETKDTPSGKPLHCKRLPFLRNIITVGFEMPGCISWNQAISQAPRIPLEEVRRRAAAVSVHDVGNMQYTSGTTGFPKGVMLTHHNIVNNGKCIGDRMDLSTADRLMIHVPMFHCFGMVLAMTAAMTHGATICPLPYFTPKSSLACINQEQITAFHGVPTMFIAMLEHPDFEHTDFSHMRTGIMAGSPCPVSVMKAVLEKMNMSEITIVFGQTESSPGCTMSSADDSIDVRVGTVGRPLPEIECRIVDPETGEELPDGETGEFVARGYNIMKGYYKMPRATLQAIDKDGWLHTGDLACRNPDGNFRITGRLKDMIIRGGENIYPKEIEEFIYTHPKVRDVQVIGVPDEQYGEEIMACVILKENEALTEEELKSYVREHTARHKVPRYVEFVTSFPMNAAGKIQKFKMREEAIESLKLRKAAEIETA